MPARSNPRSFTPNSHSPAPLAIVCVVWGFASVAQVRLRAAGATGPGSVVFSGIDFSAPLLGLMPASSYEVQLSASTDAGTTQTAWVPFTSREAGGLP